MPWFLVWVEFDDDEDDEDGGDDDEEECRLWVLVVVREDGGRGREEEEEVKEEEVKLPAPPRPKGILGGWVGWGSWRAKEEVVVVDVDMLEGVEEVVGWWWRCGRTRWLGRLEMYSRMSASLTDMRVLWARGV